MGYITFENKLSCSVNLNQYLKENVSSYRSLNFFLIIISLKLVLFRYFHWQLYIRPDTKLIKYEILTSKIQMNFFLKKFS